MKAIQTFKIKRMSYYRNRLTDRIYKTVIIKHSNFKIKTQKKYSLPVLITQTKWLQVTNLFIPLQEIKRKKMKPKAVDSKMMH
jgi:hypothetical protein